MQSKLYITVSNNHFTNHTTYILCNFMNTLFKLNIVYLAFDYKYYHDNKIISYNQEQAFGVRNKFAGLSTDSRIRQDTTSRIAKYNLKTNPPLLRVGKTEHNTFSTGPVISKRPFTSFCAVPCDVKRSWATIIIMTVIHALFN